MRLMTVRTRAGDTRACLQEGQKYWYLPASDVGALLADDEWRRYAEEQRERPPDMTGTEHDLQLAPVVLSPSKVWCVGRNYRGHLAELDRETPAYPTLFCKFADSFIGARDPLCLPGVSDQVDWEAELAVIVGRPVRRAGRQEAQAAVAGYTVANDVSVRDWQAHTTQWIQGKAFEALTPIGPSMVTADEFDPAAGHRIRCYVNDERVQDASTADLIFDVAELLSYISQIGTLRPGDIVLTGTPAGVGLARKPPRFLRPSDVLRTEIDGIGSLVNVCVPEG